MSEDIIHPPLHCSKQHHCLPHARHRRGDNCTLMLIWPALNGLHRQYPIFISLQSCATPTLRRHSRIHYPFNAEDQRLQIKTQHVWSDDWPDRLMMVMRVLLHIRSRSMLSIHYGGWMRDTCGASCPRRVINPHMHCSTLHPCPAPAHHRYGNDSNGTFTPVSLSVTHFHLLAALRHHLNVWYLWCIVSDARYQFTNALP